MKHLLMSLLITAAVSFGCGYGGGAYVSAADNFSISFPSGSGGVESDIHDAKYGLAGTKYNKSFDNRSDNYRSYEVQATALNPAFMAGKAGREILEIGLNGWEDEPGTVIRDVTVNGANAIDSVRTMEIGPARMTFREVVVWSEKDRKLYVIQIAASKKENVESNEANDFVNSFTLNGA